jgi:hypothetical protein
MDSVAVKEGLRPGLRYGKGHKYSRTSESPEYITGENINKFQILVNQNIS